MHLMAPRPVLRARGVGDPDVAVRIDVDPVRPHDHPRSEAPEQLAAGREEHDRIEARVLLARPPVAAAPLTDPDVHAVAVDVHRARRSPLPPLRKLSPHALDGAVRVRHPVLSLDLGREDGGHRHRGEQRESDVSRVDHRVPPSRGSVIGTAGPG